MKSTHAFLLTAAAVLVPFTAFAAKPELTFTKLWTHDHSAIPGQVSEIPAYDFGTNTLWIAGVVGVDVLDARTGNLIEHIDTSGLGLVNSVAIHQGLAAFAIEAPVRSEPGSVVFYDTTTRQQGSIVRVGSLPDMLVFTRDGAKLLVANEGTPDAYGARVAGSIPYVFEDADPDPAGSVSIIDVVTREVVATAGFGGVPLSGSHVRTMTGMDFEPEYIAVDADGTRAFVTLQEGNAMAILDLTTNAFERIVGLGAKDFSVPGNQVDPLDNGTTSFISPAAKGLYMPDGIAAYKWRGQTYVAMANEGDFREDDGDRVAASAFGAVAPLNRLRVSGTDSSPGELYAAGARSFSIRDAEGNLVYDSGDILDKEAFARGVYDDGRSRDKGVEPEGIALLNILGRTYAAVGLERTTKGTVALFDITDPTDVGFVDMIVTDGDIAPEGLAVYTRGNVQYLAIANEVSNTTTVYRVQRTRGVRLD